MTPRAGCSRGVRGGVKKDDDGPDGGCCCWGRGDDARPGCVGDTRGEGVGEGARASLPQEGEGERIEAAAGG